MNAVTDLGRAGQESTTPTNRVGNQFSPKSHLLALDGLRGLAILMVMIFHFYGGAEGLNVLDRLAIRLMLTGWTGVDLFFVLSGFLITGILYDAKGSKRYFLTFYARRALRIFPLYYGLLLVLLVIVPAIRPYKSAEMAEDIHQQAWLWLYGTNIAITFFHMDFPRLIHFWSLAVEEHFYFIWPALVFLLNWRQMVKVAIGAIIFAFALRCCFVAGGIGTFHFTLCRMDALGIGGLVALLARGPAGLAPYRSAAKWLASICLLSLTGMFAWNGGLQGSQISEQLVGYTLLAVLGASCLVLLLVAPKTSWPYRIFTFAPLRSIGKYSYAMYVLHWPLLPMLWSYFSLERLNLPARLHSQFLGRLPYACLACAAVYLLALASWHLYEKHFLKLKRFFEYA